MKNIAVFRYHTDVKICSNHLDIFKHFNPQVPIYGIYGGEAADFDFYSSELSQYLTHNYQLASLKAEEKWRDFDSVLFDWYFNYGKDIDFDNVYLIEWDFILLDSLENAYGHIPADKAALTGLVTVKTIEDLWFWTKHPPLRAEWLQLLNFVRTNCNYKQEPYAINCPGLRLPKSFFEKLGDFRLPILGNDELRIPMYCQITGTEMLDTNFFRDWFSNKEKRFFNCNALIVKPSTISAEYRKKEGRRAFHPVKDIIDLKRFERNSRFLYLFS
jgi:hypothetical protein